MLWWLQCLGSYCLVRSLTKHQTVEQNDKYFLRTCTTLRVIYMAAALLCRVGCFFCWMWWALCNTTLAEALPMGSEECRMDRNKKWHAPWWRFLALIDVGGRWATFACVVCICKHILWPCEFLLCWTAPTMSLVALGFSAARFSAAVTCRGDVAHGWGKIRWFWWRRIGVRLWLHWIEYWMQWRGKSRDCRSKNSRRRRKILLIPTLKYTEQIFYLQFFIYQAEKNKVKNPSKKVGKSNWFGICIVVEGFRDK